MESSSITVDLHCIDDIWYAVANFEHGETVIATDKDKDVCVTNAKALMKKVVENVSKEGLLDETMEKLKVTAITEDGVEILYEKE